MANTHLWFVPAGLVVAGLQGSSVACRGVRVGAGLVLAVPVQVVGCIGMGSGAVPVAYERTDQEGYGKKSRRKRCHGEYEACPVKVKITAACTRRIDEYMASRQLLVAQRTGSRLHSNSHTRVRGRRVI